MQAVITHIVFSAPAQAWTQHFNTPYGDSDCIDITPAAARAFLRVWPHIERKEGNYTTYKIIQDPQLNRRS